MTQPLNARAGIAVQFSTEAASLPWSGMAGLVLCCNNKLAHPDLLWALVVEPNWQGCLRGRLRAVARREKTSLWPVANPLSFSQTPSQLQPGADLRSVTDSRHDVYAGINIVEMNQINLHDDTFFADFYLWFRWQGDFDARKFEFVNARASRWSGIQGF
jgi:hypothetical protein